MDLIKTLSRKYTPRRSGGNTPSRQRDLVESTLDGEYVLAIPARSWMMVAPQVIGVPNARVGPSIKDIAPKVLELTGDEHKEERKRRILDNCVYLTAEALATEAVVLRKALGLSMEEFEKVLAMVGAAQVEAGVNGHDKVREHDHRAMLYAIA